MSAATTMVFSPDAAVAEMEVRAILFVLVAFAHVDGAVDVAESGFIHDTIDRIVEGRANEGFADDPLTRADVVPRWKAHFYQAVASMDHDIRADRTESVAAGESAMSFVHARLKLRCFELLDRLKQPNRLAVLGMIDRLMVADGVVHPAEHSFRNELFSLLQDEATRVTLASPRALPGTTTVEEPRDLRPTHADHPFFSAFEQPYAADPVTFARQAGGDVELIRRATARLAEARDHGRGRLAGVLNVGEVAGHQPFLDGFVHVHPAARDVDYELLVLGDLHGCYTCLKAALIQGDFLAKVDAYRTAPDRHPYPALVLLGDYIDRGHHSYDGVLRTVLRLYLAAPGHVYALRGNHEQYVERFGMMTSPVRPAEAIESIASIAPRELLVAHKALFDQLPSVLLFDRLLFVHAGIPREDTIATKVKDLAALNDAEVRLQMAWSDPSDADYVPLDLQRANARFPFGRMQFRAFMARLGCTLLVRGHERVVEGLRQVYDDPDAMLLSLFSSGGASNADLPEWSNYRQVVPTALIIRHRNGKSRVSPFPIAYELWNEPARNGLLRA